MRYKKNWNEWQITNNVEFNFRNGHLSQILVDGVSYTSRYNKNFFFQCDLWTCVLLLFLSLFVFFSVTTGLCCKEMLLVVICYWIPKLGQKCSMHRKFLIEINFDLRLCFFFLLAFNYCSSAISVVSFTNLMYWEVLFF